ncbi:MAG: CNNM domain-containing protein [Pirellulaceae bacterium]
MTAVEETLPWLPAMLLLICMSAFFSGSEAALFSLQPQDRRRLKKNKAVGLRVDQLLQDPERLLSAVLFWNLIINMAYFGIVSIAGKKLEATGDARLAVGFTFLCLMTIIFFSEMLPKSVAVKNPIVFSSWVVRWLTYAIWIISPALPILTFANRIAQRIVWPRFQAERELEIEDIDRAIRLSAPDEAFADRERMLLRRLISLTDVRVDEWMRPRSECHIYQFPLPADAIQTSIDESGYLLIGDDSDEGDDAIIGCIAVRWLRPSQMDDLQAAMEPPLICRGRPTLLMYSMNCDRKIAMSRRLSTNTARRLECFRSTMSWRKSCRCPKSPNQRRRMTRRIIDPKPCCHCGWRAR